MFPRNDILSMVRSITLCCNQWLFFFLSGRPIWTAWQNWIAWNRNALFVCNTVCKTVLLKRLLRSFALSTSLIVVNTLRFDLILCKISDPTSRHKFPICLHSISLLRFQRMHLDSSIYISRRYPAKTITDADYADDIAILANTPNQAETLLHNLERAGIGLCVNAHKTEYMCDNQTGDISTIDGTPLKLVDKFTYLGSSVSSTEKDIDTRLTKAWTAINRLSIIWKSDLTDKMKRRFF